MSVIKKYTPTENNEMAWSKVVREPYSPKDVGSYMQRIISRKDESHNIEFRYFVLNPNDRSNFEKHNYEHIVFIISGRGSILLENEEYDIYPHDSIFISCDEIHQLRAVGEEPLTFLCIVLDKELRFHVHGEQYLELYDTVSGKFKERKEWKDYNEMIKDSSTTRS
jgi:mannose-6-phosphate isomerase-like protein (cupin superfamily)